MELGDALRQIADIRRQMAKSEIFRGYRSATVGFSGALALASAAFQHRLVPSPQTNLVGYLTLWIAVASISLSVAGGEMIWRTRSAGAGLARELTRLAVGQFFPCLVVGGLLTLFIATHAPEVAWMLPGLWSLLFALGVFASCRLLPDSVVWVGVHFVVAGLVCLLFGRGSQWLAAWQMAVTFGGGQLLAASILYWTLERSDGSSA